MDSTFDLLGEAVDPSSPRELMSLIFISTRTENVAIDF